MAGRGTIKYCSLNIPLPKIIIIMLNKLHYILFVNSQYGVQKKYNKNRTKLFFDKKFYIHLLSEFCEKLNCVLRVRETFFDSR